VRYGIWGLRFVGVFFCLFFFLLGFAMARPEEAPSGAGPHLGVLHYVGRLINFGLLAFLLYYLVVRVGRLPDALQTQREELLREMEEARQQKEAAEVKWREVQARLQTLSDELERMRQAAEADAQREAERILTEAAAEVERLKHLAEEEIRRAAAFARAEVQAYVATAVARMVEGLLKTHLTPEDHVRLIEASLEKLKSDEVTK
jgi:F0F1-type ATP synthase membrane subunit b/b'